MKKGISLIYIACIFSAVMISQTVGPSQVFVPAAGGFYSPYSIGIQSGSEQTGTMFHVGVSNSSPATISTPYQSQWYTYESEFTGHTLQVMMQRGYSATYGDYVYFGGTGNGSNKAQTAMIMGSSTGLYVGAGSDSGNALTGTPYMQINSSGTTIPSIKSTTGTRYVCVDTNGKLVSSSSACSGT